MVASRRALFCTLIPIGLTFLACGGSADPPNSEAEVEVRESTPSELGAVLRWKGFRLQPTPIPKRHWDFLNSVSTHAAYDLTHWPDEITLREFENWCYKTWDLYTCSVALKVRTKSGEIWWVVPSISLPMGERTHLLKGTPGKDELGMELNMVGNHQPSGLWVDSDQFAQTEWLEFKVENFHRPELGLAFNLERGVTIKQLMVVMEMAARANAPVVSFHEYILIDPIPMPEED